MADLQPSPENSTQPKADLALEGGGVKGVGLVGAITALASHGYTFPGSPVRALERLSGRLWQPALLETKTWRFSKES